MVQHHQMWIWILTQLPGIFHPNFVFELIFKEMIDLLWVELTATYSLFLWVKLSGLLRNAYIFPRIQESTWPVRKKIYICVYQTSVMNKLTHCYQSWQHPLLAQQLHLQVSWQYGWLLEYFLLPYVSSGCWNPHRECCNGMQKHNYRAQGSRRCLHQRSWSGSCPMCCTRGHCEQGWKLWI